MTAYNYSAGGTTPYYEYLDDGTGSPKQFPQVADIDGRWPYPKWW